MLIRNIGIEDILPIAEIEKECFSDAWSEKTVAELIDSEYDITGAAEIEGIVYAYINFRILGGELELMRIAVRPGYRNRGIGRELMKYMMKTAAEAGAGTAFLEVRESNTAAIALYESFGFMLMGRRKLYYHNPDEDAVLMKSELLL